MRSFLLVVGGIAFLVGGVMAGAADTVFQQIEGSIGVVVGVVALGAAGIIDAVDRLRDATIKIHDLERIERVQRDLTSADPEVAARAREAVGPKS